MTLLPEVGHIEGEDPGIRTAYVMQWYLSDSYERITSLLHNSVMACRRFSFAKDFLLENKKQNMWYFKLYYVTLR